MEPVIQNVLTLNKLTLASSRRVELNKDVYRHITYSSYERRRLGVLHLEFF